MTGSAVTAARPLSLSLPLVTAVVSVAAFLALQWAGWSRAGVFEYPLDDTYIHLAVAAQIAQGGYGVNAGEPASAASSILYPLLLVPFAGTEAQRWLPLVWNLAGLLASALLWGRLLVQSGLVAWQAVALAVLGPLAFNLPGLAVLGMEHALHLAVSLAALSGLADFLRTGRIGVLLVAGAILAPALRFEGMALALAVAGTVAIRGRPGAGAALALAAILPVAAFMAFLVSQGLGPLPSSVQAKMAVGGETDRLAATADTLALNLSRRTGQGLLVLALLALLGGLLLARRHPVAWTGIVAGACVLAHLVLGQIGWLNRYEPYAVALSLSALALLAGMAGAWLHRLLVAGGVLAAMAVSATYVSSALFLLPRNPQAIHLQQGQMARFAQDYLAAPVAVNDLGRVAWGNPYHVLDLWGLASAEALRIRHSDPPPGWAGPLAAARGVEVAMIYDTWLSHAVGADWTPLGALVLGPGVGPAFIGDRRVTFYATGPDVTGRVRAALDAWVPTLPAGALWEPAP